MAPTQLATFLVQEKLPFQQEPFYEPVTDSLLVYTRNERSYAKRINSHFTVFLSTSDETLVGFEIKGVGVICRGIESMGMRTIAGPIDVSDEDGKCSMSVLMHVAMGDPEIELDGSQYVELNKATRGRKVDLKLEESL